MARTAQEVISEFVNDEGDVTDEKEMGERIRKLIFAAKSCEKNMHSGHYEGALDNLKFIKQAADLAIPVLTNYINRAKRLKGR